MQQIDYIITSRLVFWTSPPPSTYKNIFTLSNHFKFALNSYCLILKASDIGNIFMTIIVETDFLERSSFCVIKKENVLKQQLLQINWDNKSKKTRETGKWSRFKLLNVRWFYILTFRRKKKYSTSSFFTFTL